MDSTLPWTLAIIAFLPMLLKQYINVIQMMEASKWLAAGDIEMRRQQGLPRQRKLK